MTLQEFRKTKKLVDTIEHLDELHTLFSMYAADKSKPQEVKLSIDFPSIYTADSIDVTVPMNVMEKLMDIVQSEIEKLKTEFENI